MFKLPKKGSYKSCFFSAILVGALIFFTEVSDGWTRGVIGAATFILLIFSSIFYIIGIDRFIENAVFLGDPKYWEIFIANMKRGIVFIVTLGIVSFSLLQLIKLP